MRKSLWDADARQQLLARLERLKPDTRPVWGTMDAPQMLAHLANWMDMAKGDLPTKFRNRPLRYPGIKQLVIYWIPFPHGVPTAVELIDRPPSDWAREYDAVRRAIEAFASMHPDAAWPTHPAFGKLTPKAWGVLGYRHTDHHLRQFGT